MPSCVYHVVLLTLMLGASAALAVRQVTFISDIHYDPRYGTPDAFSRCKTSASSVWGVSGCDSSPQLTQRALNDVSDQNTSFIFYGGDWQRHGYTKSGLKPAELFLDLSERFRNVSVDGSLGVVAFGGSIGNNDVVPDYYFAWSSASSGFAASKEELAYRVQAMTTVGLLSASEAKVAARCGYYTHEMETLHVIVLHTLLWAFRLEPSMSDSVTDPCGQFAFLKAELQKVRDASKRAIILGHIPPGLNVYNVLQGGFNKPEDDLFWKPEYQETYDAVIHAYKDLVAVQLFGHTHKFTLQVFPANGALSMIIPAISPIFANNPSYLLANFSGDDWVLEDVQLRYATEDGVFHAGQAARTALKTAFELAALPQLRSSITALASNDETWANYLKLFCGGEKRLAVFPDEECDTHCRYVVVCAMLENRHPNIQRCVADFEAATSSESRKVSPWVAALIIICSLVVLGVAAMLVLMARSGQTTLAWANFRDIAWWKSLLKRQPHTSVVVETELQTQW
jgi:sphingomyelin phosphodiesterase acid-like 3